MKTYKQEIYDLQARIAELEKSAWVQADIAEGQKFTLLGCRARITELEAIIEWADSNAQARSLHMDGTAEYRLHPTYQRAKCWSESVILAIKAEIGVSDG